MAIVPSLKMAQVGSHKRLIESSMAMLSVMLICGCQSGLYKISTSEDGKKIDDSIRYVEVAQGKDVDETRFMKDGGSSSEGMIYDESKMPIEIVEGKSEKFPDQAGISGVLWLFTVGIWPMCHSEYMTQEITVKSPTGERSGTYRVDAKWWAGWLPIFVGYPSSADERIAEATLPNRRIEGLAKDRLVKSLAGEFSFQEYVAYAKKENASRGKEIERIAVSKKRIEELIAKNKYDEATALCDSDSKGREGSLKKDLEIWSDLKKLIGEKKEDYRVAMKKADLEKKMADKKYEEVVAACGKESNGEARHKQIWKELKENAEKEISKANRSKELARIEKRKAAILKLHAAKDYANVIAECEKEKGGNPGSEASDATIWAELKKDAIEAKGKAERTAELARIAEKEKSLRARMLRKDYEAVIAACEEEHGQNPGARPEDMQRWKTLLAEAENRLADLNAARGIVLTPRTFCGVDFGENLDLRFPKAELVDKSDDRSLSHGDSYMQADLTLQNPFRNFKEGWVYASMTTKQIYSIKLRYEFPRNVSKVVDKAECEGTVNALKKKYRVNPTVEKSFGGDEKYQFKVGDVVIVLEHITEGIVDRGHLILTAENVKYAKVAKNESQKYYELRSRKDLENMKSFEGGGVDAL